MQGLEVLAEATRYAMDMGILEKLIEGFATSEKVLEATTRGLDQIHTIRGPTCNHTPERLDEKCLQRFVEECAENLSVHDRRDVPYVVGQTDNQELARFRSVGPCADSDEAFYHHVQLKLDPGTSEKPTCAQVSVDLTFWAICFTI